MERSELTGIILAGGKSSRMGQEKGLVDFRGKPLIQYSIDLLSAFTDRILISSSNPCYLHFGLEMVPDDVAGQGPASGIAAALQRSGTDWNLMIACDLPFLRPELIDRLLGNSENFQAVAPIHNGILEPLAGLYHKELAPHFATSVHAGRLALHNILADCRVNCYDASALLQQYPQLFSNLNSATDLERHR
jgi:molybdenum cofactor guanylyltransferase